MKARACALAAAALTMVAITATAGAQTLSPTLPGPSTFGKIQMVDIQTFRDRPTTLAQYELLAKSTEMVVGHPATLASEAPTLKSLNPSIKLLVYENGMMSTPADPSNFPESWYLHDSAGNRVVSKSYGNALMNPLSTAPFTNGGTTYDGWSQYVTTECERDQRSYTSGCYLDVLGPARLAGIRNANGDVPIDPRTGQPFVPSAYEDMAGSVADAVRNAMPAGTTIIGNGYASGGGYYFMDTSELNHYLDSGQAQGWMAGSDQTLSLPRWQRSVQMIMDSGNAGASMIVTYDAESTTNLGGQRAFALASYLLGNTGHAYFDFMQGAHTHSWENWSALYDVNLGTPTENADTVAGYLTGSVYERTYTNGIVVVNPGPGAASVQLPGTYTTIAGASVTSITLNGHSAMILSL
jgi:hypothetical protein